MKAARDARRLWLWPGLMLSVVLGCDPGKLPCDDPEWTAICERRRDGGVNPARATGGSTAPRILNADAGASADPVRSDDLSAARLRGLRPRQN